MEPSSPEFGPPIVAAGRAFSQAGVVGVYLAHGTFAGNDAVGLLTELSRYAPGLSESLRKFGKGVVDAVVGETGNYTPEYSARFEELISEGAGRPIPVTHFHWSSQNTHIGRADGAVGLIAELARFSEQLPAYVLPQAPSPRRGELGRGAPSSGSSIVSQHPSPSPSPSRGGEQRDKVEPSAPRLLLWGHSHAGNVFALMSHLLGGDAHARREFFHAALSFYRRWWGAGVDLPVWQHVEELLADAAHPLRRVELDFVTFGTPIRYGWGSAGYSRLLHFVNHRPASHVPAYQAAYPLDVRRMLAAADGDYIQHLGIAGTGLPVNPLATRTMVANWRLRRLFQRGLRRAWFHSRLRCGKRVADEGSTLLVEYDDPETNPFCHLLGHAAYTRSRWLPLHCALVAEQFYGPTSPAN